MNIKRKRDHQQYAGTENCFYSRTNITTFSVCLILAFIFILIINDDWFHWYTENSILIEVVFCIFCFALSGLNKIRFKDYRFLLIVIAYCFISMLVNHGGLGSIFSNCFGMIWCVVLQHCKFSRKSYLYVCVLFFILFISMLNISSGSIIESWEMGKLSYNPNTVGFFMAISSEIILLYLEYSFPLSIIVQAFIIIYTVIMIGRSGSRAALAMYFLFVLLKYLIPYRFKGKRGLIIIYSAVFAIGILFPVVYVALYTRTLPMPKQILKLDGTLLRKSIFTGREVIWMDLFSLLGNSMRNWLIGVGSHMAFERYRYEINSHNIFMTILVNFGLAGLGLYYWFYVIQIKKVFENRKVSRIQIDIVCVCISYFLLGVFETTPIWIPFAVITGLLWAMPYCLNRRI